MLFVMAIILAAAQTPDFPAPPTTCAQAKATDTAPADQLELLDQFRAHLAKADLERLDQALPRSSNGGIAQCDAAEGSRASCEVTAYMPAIENTGLMAQYLAFICPKKF
ncbi:hypothetical protein HGO34_16705 [Agrobacterium vitis]|uniref:Uncharacterized protein n=1 Tax=Agrobacterium vitis TaxID=373 RepID=A0AAE4W8P7_AGRVI|nr:hypothetical protein [Agrobacterium vitis]MCF1497746.1 hypothetical protein [Allorhizobium sp. Av2]MCM2441364.1 hypothetical protein [Agrobacterium vitis]MUZ55886.1 hypothetical protein [Agrobacterium vitis]MVA68694.1 hypothetical protein [Agrobacterium vitis]MVA89572.1 hypothetical protein [Agrobacterium vitis]